MQLFCLMLRASDRNLKAIMKYSIEMKGTFPMAVQNPPSLFIYELCVLYDAEQQLVQMLPILAQECDNQEAKDAFLQHEQETRQHIRNIEQCFQMLGTQQTTCQNHTIEGLKQDHDMFTLQKPPQEALTMFNLNSAYQSEYIEISSYNSLIDAANSLGLQQCVQLFQQNLQQEEAAARKLGSIIHQMGMQSTPMHQEQATLSNQPNAGNAAQLQHQPAMIGNQQGGNQAFSGMNQPYEVDIPEGQSEVFIAGSQRGTDPTNVGSSSQTTDPTNVGSNVQAATQSSSGDSTEPSTANAAMHPRVLLQLGMEVVGQDIGHIGTVKEIREADFLVDRKMKRDVYVPFNAIQNVDDGRATLNIPVKQVDTMGWQRPPLI
jgi:ferritin-like metal-binding protein YciE